jgi:hypothetical protein
VARCDAARERDVSLRELFVFADCLAGQAQQFLAPAAGDFIYIHRNQ